MRAAWECEHLWIEVGCPGRRTRCCFECGEEQWFMMARDISLGWMVMKRGSLPVNHPAYLAVYGVL